VLESSSSKSITSVDDDLLPLAFLLFAGCCFFFLVGPRFRGAFGLRTAAAFVPGAFRLLPFAVNHSPLPTLLAAGRGAALGLDFGRAFGSRTIHDGSFDWMQRSPRLPSLRYMTVLKWQNEVSVV
jgi:hypothetical protein